MNIVTIEWLGEALPNGRYPIHINRDHSRSRQVNPWEFSFSAHTVVAEVWAHTRRGTLDRFVRYPHPHYRIRDDVAAVRVKIPTSRLARVQRIASMILDIQDLFEQDACETLMALGR